jgi:hypothetical protein
VHHLLPALISNAREHSIEYILITDGVHSVILSIVFNRCGPWVSIARRADWPFRVHLGYLLWYRALKEGVLALHGWWHFNDMAGALPRGPPMDHMLSCAPSCMADFDLYTVERDKRAWKKFEAWKTRAAVQALAHPTAPGHQLLACTRSFSDSNRLWRSPWPVVPPSADDLDTFTSHARPVHETLHRACHTAGAQLTFTVTTVVKAGADVYSQVFFGLASCNVAGHTTTPVRLCLKLYDERLFQAPAHRVNPWNSELRPSSWNVAEDLARREEAAYDRLRELQGSLLPHSYGFHYVSLISN